MNTYIVKVKEVLNERPMTYPEIEARLGLSREQSSRAVQTLVKQGLCKRLPKRRYVGSAT